MFPEDSPFYIAGMILFGALANALRSLQRARSEESIVYGLIDFVISMGISMFAGVMFGLVSQYLSHDPLVIYASAGMGAYLGISGLNKLTDLAFEFITQATRPKG